MNRDTYKVGGEQSPTKNWADFQALFVPGIIYLISRAEERNTTNLMSLIHHPTQELIIIRKKMLEELLKNIIRASDISSEEKKNINYYKAAWMEAFEKYMSTNNISVTRTTYMKEHCELWIEEVILYSKNYLVTLI